MMSEEKTKSFAVSRGVVYNSYLKVCSKDGAAGIDRETIEMFNKDLSSNLYKIWNACHQVVIFRQPYVLY
jgi:RNA-directed DNA polymerase